MYWPLDGWWSDRVTLGVDWLKSCRDISARSEAVVAEKAARGDRRAGARSPAPLHSLLSDTADWCHIKHKKHAGNLFIYLCNSTSAVCSSGVAEVLLQQVQQVSYVVCSVINVNDNDSKNSKEGLQSRSRSSMESYGTVLKLDWSIVAETARFEGVTQISCTRTEDSLNLGGQNLHRWNLRLMLNISYAGCPDLPQIVSAKVTLKMCVTASNREKFV